MRDKFEEFYGDKGDILGNRWPGERYESQPVTDKKAQFNTFLHYTDPTAREERTVFGAAKKGLFYNYSDRLVGQRWSEGWEMAMRACPGMNSTYKSAEFFEIVLNHFHDSTDVNLQHVILGCNMSNGYDYLVFGYTYTSKSKQ